MSIEEAMDILSIAGLTDNIHPDNIPGCIARGDANEQEVDPNGGQGRRNHSESHE
jgi:hypothetical protein